MKLVLTLNGTLPVSVILNEVKNLNYVLMSTHFRFHRYFPINRGLRFSTFAAKASFVSWVSNIGMCRSLSTAR